MLLPFQGEWKPKQIENPNYKGVWVHPEIENPEYTPDSAIYKYDSIGVLGLDLWQVGSAASGTWTDRWPGLLDGPIFTACLSAIAR